MDLTIDDCIALAARECATDGELRAALCVAVGQALHSRYEARGYSDAAETAKRDARMAALECVRERDALWAERDAALAELKQARESVQDAAEVWRLRASLDSARAERDRLGALVSAAREERDRAVREREDFGLRASAAERERDEARTERDAALARPTYEARTVAPTPEELAAHEAVGGLWLILTVGQRYHVMQVTTRTLAMDVVPQTWIALDARGLPCAWPVVAKVSP